MKDKYTHIFEPLTVRTMTIKNRICMMPMGTNYGEQNGEMSFLHIDYYRQRAKGGTGLLIVENANVDFPQGSNGTTQLRIDHDNYLPRLYKFCEDMHRYGTKVSIQINHAGASAMSSRIGGLQPVSASNIPSKTGGATPRPLTKDEILAIVKKYGEAAKRAQTAGFDAVEIHAGHSYLISQFLSPVYNDRTDEFGGSIENRTRFCRMIIDEVRSQIGPHMPIMLRLSADEFVKGGNTLEDTLKYLEYLNDEVDIFDVSCGLNDSIQYQIDANYMKDGWRSYMAKAVKEKFGKPVISMGNYRDPQVVEDTLARGDCDLIGMGRGLIAEPNWVHKVANDQECMLRKCISCNIGCAGNRIGVNRPIRCTVNPAVPEGDIYKALKVNKNCNVVVVGAGTAGMEAACTAAEVGCNVFVLEKNDHIGGLSTFISDLPSKTRMKDFPKYLEARAARLKNLYIFLNTEATVDKIKQFKPDIIVNSPGSVPLVPPIKGLKENIDAGNVNTIFGMINNVNAGKYPEEACQSKKVVVVGGGSVGLDVIEYFAPRGAECTIIDMLPQIGMLADPITKCSMRETHDKYGVKEYVNTALQEVNENAFTVKLPDGTIQDLTFDYGFNCLGMRSNNPILPELQEAFADTHTYIYTIGDSVRARRIMEGTMEGRAILNVLESQGYLHLEPLE